MAETARARVLAWASVGVGAWIVVSAGARAIESPLFWIAVTVEATAWPALWLAPRRDRSRGHRNAWSVAWSLLVAETVVLAGLAALTVLAGLLSLKGGLGIVLGAIVFLLLVLCYSLLRLEQAVARLTTAVHADKPPTPRA